MEAKLSGAFAVAIFLLGPLACAAQQAAPSSGVQQPALVRPESGSPLPTGAHKAVINVRGARVGAEILIEPEGAKPAPVGKSEDPFPASHRGEAAPGADLSKVPVWRQWTPLIAAGATPLLLLGAGMLVYFRIIRPRRRLRPFAEACSLVSEGRYNEAMPALSAVESSLPATERNQARFLSAFCAVMEQAYPEAELILSALRREAPAFREAAYLLAWLFVRQKRYSEAEPLLDELERNDWLDRASVRRLASITKLCLAHKAFEEGRIAEAAERFEKVQSLSLFAQHVPSDLRDQHIVIGLRALYERDVSAAREQFLQIEAAARKLPTEDRARQMIKAKLGLGLAAWLENSPASLRKAEELLEETAQLLAPGEPVERAWPEEIPDRDLLERIDQAAQRKDAPRLPESQACLRDVHFLRAMAVLRRWKALEGADAHRRVEEHYTQALSRLACAWNADEEFADAYLAAGLLMYYLRPAAADQSRALALLRKAGALGVRDPETLELLAAEDRRERSKADAVAQYMEMLDRYLSDETVRRELREAVLARLASYRRFPTLDVRPDFSESRTVEPSVEEICRRSETLAARLREVMRAKGQVPDDYSAATEKLKGKSQVLAEQARAVEATESELLQMAGKLLFED